MPTSFTYPGVYVEEIPSGVRTITGVATSITAFMGRTRRGPVNEPRTINSFADFERIFGGLSIDSTLGYAVRDFYRNGGSQAIIVRLFRPFFATEAARQAALNEATAQAQTAADAVVQAARDAVTNNATPGAVADAAEAAVAAAGTPGPAAQAAAVAIAQAARDAEDGANDAEAVADAAEAAVAGAVTAAVNAATSITKAQLAVGTLNLEAAYEGAWGNALRARIDHNVAGPDAANLFNLSIKDGDTDQIETIRNVSVQRNHSRRVDNVLEQESKLVRVRGAPPDTRPGPSEPTATQGVVPPGEDPFAADTSSGVTANASDSQALTTAEYTGNRANKQGLFALEKVDLFNLLCIPPHTAEGNVDQSVITDAATYCEERRAFLLVDPPTGPTGWTDKDKAKEGINAGIGTRSKNAAVFFPRFVQPNPLRDNQEQEFVPCGAVAGVFARTDAQRGVWKAPAGLAATLSGVPKLSVRLTDPEIGELNPWE